MDALEEEVCAEVLDKNFINTIDLSAHDLVARNYAQELNSECVTYDMNQGD